MSSEILCCCLADQRILKFYSKSIVSGSLNPNLKPKDPKVLLKMYCFSIPKPQTPRIGFKILLLNSLGSMSLSAEAMALQQTGRRPVTLCPQVLQGPSTNLPGTFYIGPWGF